MAKGSRLEGRGQATPARVIGVYGTAHTTKGDIITGPPEEVWVDCELITFVLPMELPRFSSLHSMTLHLGVHTVTTKIDPPISARFFKLPCHIVQSVAFLGLDYTEGDKVPEWAHHG